MATTLDAAFARRIQQEILTPWATLAVQHGTAVYTLEPTDRPDLPGTHKLTGNHGVTYGYWSEVSGRTVRIPRAGWSGTRGVLGTFDTRDTPNPDNSLPTLRVKGWAVVPYAV
jgi:hypothetical protein